MHIPKRSEKCSFAFNMYWLNLILKFVNRCQINVGIFIVKSFKKSNSYLYELTSSSLISSRVKWQESVDGASYVPSLLTFP
jgi:hypothetical protein